MNTPVSAEQRLIEDPQPFLNWLETLPKKERFGTGTCDCALAKFSGHEVGFCTYSGAYTLPDWAIRFTETTCRGKKSFTVKRAISVMQRLV